LPILKSNAAVRAAQRASQAAFAGAKAAKIKLFEENSRDALLERRGDQGNDHTVCAIGLGQHQHHLLPQARVRSP
jgi:hypothetical protein